MRKELLLLNNATFKCLFGFKTKKIISNFTKYYQNLKALSEKNIIFENQKSLKCQRAIKISTELRLYLLKKNLQNKWLAELLGRDQATVSKWVTNSAQPSLEMLIKISDCLGVSVEDLIRKESVIQK